MSLFFLKKTNPKKKKNLGYSDALSKELISSDKQYVNYIDLYLFDMEC